MNQIGQDEINEIRSKVDIVDVISEYLPLVPKGKNYFGVCPFHDDHAPSMSVSKEKQIYTCFSCGASGNVFKFIMDYEQVSFPESINIIASKAGIDVNYKVNRKPKIDSYLYDIYDIASKLYQNNINTKDGQAAFKYLESREIDSKTIKEFGIGVATKKNDLILKVLKSKEYTEEQMLNSAIINNGKNGLHDIFYNRVMFPIWNVSGKVVGFSGRVYNGETDFKYINTRETDIFKKGELLYNYHRAKEFARKENTVIIMEGQFDVIRSYSKGIKNVIGTMGTAITKEHALLIKRIALNVILCFDGDSAGKKATMACIKELSKVGVVPKVVILEDGMDPDEYLKKYGVKTFKNLLDNPINVMDFKLGYHKIGKDFTNSVDMGNYIHEILDELLEIKDPILQEITLKKVSEESNLDIGFLREQLYSSKKIEVNSTIETNNNKNRVKTKYEKAEMYLLFYMLRSSEVIHVYDNKITYMPTKKYRFLAREISHYYKIQGNIELADFMTYISEKDELMEAVSEVNRLSLKDEYSLSEIDDYIKTILDYNIEIEIKRLTNEMKQVTDPIKKASIASRIVDIRLKGENYE